jgi:glycosyltransferase involved in cell wall biosynthesis
LVHGSALPEADLCDVDRLRPMELPPLPDRPLVSVLIGNYNYGNYLGQAIESVLEQKYQNFEICICDDGSTDESVGVMQRYSIRDERIRFVIQKNTGQGAALNAAWALAQGEVIALLDSDDVWLPEKLSSIVAQFSSLENVGLVAHRLSMVWDDLRAIRPQRFRQMDDGWLAGKLMRPPGYLLLAACSGLALRREVARRVLPLDPTFRCHADSVIAERAALLTNVASIPTQLGLYRIHRANITGGGGPRDLAAARKDISLYEARMADRRSFILREYGIKLRPESWRLGEDAYLAEQLFLGERPAPDLLTQLQAVSVPRALLWRIIFACPRPVGVGLLRLRGRESRWKHWLKFFLRLPS